MKSLVPADLDDKISTLENSIETQSAQYKFLQENMDNVSDREMLIRKLTAVIS